MPCYSSCGAGLVPGRSQACLGGACKAGAGSPCMRCVLLQEHLSYRQGPTKHFFESAEGASGRGHSLGRHVILSTLSGIMLHQHAQPSTWTAPQGSAGVGSGLCMLLP